MLKHWLAISVLGLLSELSVRGEPRGTPEASADQGDASHAYGQRAGHWTEWWGHYRDALAHRAPALPLSARQRIVRVLQNLVDGPLAAQPSLLPHALLGQANFGARLPAPEQQRILETLLLQLGSPDSAVCERAALALGVLGDPQALGPLTELALDTAWGRRMVAPGTGPVAGEMRAFALYGLGLLGDEQRDEPLRRNIAAVLWKVCEAPRESAPDVKMAAILSMGLVPLEHCSPMGCRASNVSWQQHPPAAARKWNTWASYSGELEISATPTWRSPTHHVP